ncbi:putative transporter [Escherichia coli]|uniref:Putative transporter n=1 Tax=Escherichia coli TaxID=562 RepID=A0A485JQK1_ECOLX|nr:putative transporter [Escherichia coli]
MLGDLLNYFFGGGSVSFVTFSCLAFFGSAFVNSLNWALVSDTVEYGEWRTGVRSEGTVYTGFTFFRKVSQALLVSSPVDADANRLCAERRTG